MKRDLIGPLGAALLLLGCAPSLSKQRYDAAMDEVRRSGTPDPLRPLHAQLIVGGERDYVRNAMVLGLEAARAGYYDMAASVFDQAIRRIETAQINAAQEARHGEPSRSEAAQIFLGEPYERAALYLYRSVLYFERGAFPEAVAAAQRAQRQGVPGWPAVEWLLTFAERKNGERTLVLVEAGVGPQKRADGPGQQVLIVTPGEVKSRQIAAVDRAGRLMQSGVGMIEDLGRQALRERRTLEYGTERARFASQTSFATFAPMPHTLDAPPRLLGEGVRMQGVASDSMDGVGRVDTRAFSNLPGGLFLLSVPSGLAQVRASDDKGQVLMSHDVAESAVRRSLLWLRAP